MKIYLNGAKSRIVLRTVAEGLFARLAHDLEIVAEDVTGQVEEPEAAPGAPRASATVRVPVRGLHVAGAVRDGRLKEGVLSASDRAEIEERIRDGAFGGGGEIVVVATLAGARVTLDVRAPQGRQLVEVPVQVNRTADSVHASGECALSLRALGIPPVRGPVGAFRLADRVDVKFDAAFERETEDNSDQK